MTHQIASLPAHVDEAGNQFAQFAEQVRRAHPEYEENLRLARRAAELQEQYDRLAAQQTQPPIATYNINL